jgi:hypothetical protein
LPQHFLIYDVPLSLGRAAEFQLVCDGTMTLSLSIPRFLIELISEPYPA